MPSERPYKKQPSRSHALSPSRNLKAHGHVDVPAEAQHFAADPGSAAVCCTKEVSLTKPFLGERVRSKSSNTASCMSLASLLAVMPSIPLMGYLALTHRFPLRKPIDRIPNLHTQTGKDRYGFFLQGVCATRVLFMAFPRISHSTRHLRLQGPAFEIAIPTMISTTVFYTSLQSKNSSTRPA